MLNIPIAISSVYIKGKQLIKLTFLRTQIFHFAEDSSMFSGHVVAMLKKEAPL